MRRMKQKPIKGKCFEVHNVLHPFGKKMNTNELIKLSKMQLRVNKANGLDRSVTAKDLTNPLNARVYLMNTGSLVKSCNTKKKRRKK